MAKNQLLVKASKDADVTNMFRSAMSLGDKDGINIRISYEKYKSLECQLTRFSKIINLLESSFNNICGEVSKNSIIDFKNGVNEDLMKIFGNDPPNFDMFLDISMAPKIITDEFRKRYLFLKNCQTINNIIITRGNLIPFTDHIKNKDQLSDKFFAETPGTIMILIEGLNLNFKEIYHSSDNSSHITFLLLILNKIYDVTDNIYSQIKTPDIDIDALCELIKDNIDMLKSHIPRCGEAFDKIVESMSLLKERFGTYYQDFLSSGSKNSSIIMENFVLDVAQNFKTSPKIAHQFKKIIDHYRGLAKTKSENPSIGKLFSYVDEGFDQISKFGVKVDEEPTTEKEEEEITEKS